MSLSQKKRTTINSAAVVAIMGFAFAVCGTAQSQTDEDESTRGVRIIGAPTPPSAVGSPSQVLVSPDGDTTSPALLAPVAPSPSIVAPPPAPPAVSTATPVPALLTPAVKPPPSEVPAPVAPADVPTTLQPVPNNFANAPNNPDIGPRPTPGSRGAFKRHENSERRGAFDANPARTRHRCRLSGIIFKFQARKRVILFSLTSMRPVSLCKSIQIQCLSWRQAGLGSNPTISGLARHSRYPTGRALIPGLNSSPRLPLELRW